MSEVDKWYRDYWKRLEVRQKLHQLRVPRIHWFYADEMNEVEQIIYNRIRHAKRILDYGAGDMRLKNKFLAMGYNGEYETLDLSKEYKHDYNFISEVSGTYDAILCLDVIEHMSLNEYVDLMDKFKSLLNDKSKLIISTSNPLCISPMWAGDAGHIQQFPLADLGADFLVRGFDIELFRIRYGERPKSFTSHVRLLIQRALCYFLSVDYTHGLLVIGNYKS